MKAPHDHPITSHPTSSPARSRRGGGRRQPQPSRCGVCDRQLWRNASMENKTMHGPCHGRAGAQKIDGLPQLIAEKKGFSCPAALPRAAGTPSGDHRANARPLLSVCPSSGQWPAWDWRGRREMVCAPVSTGQVSAAQRVAISALRPSAVGRCCATQNPRFASQSVTSGTVYSLP